MLPPSRGKIQKHLFFNLELNVVTKDLICFKFKISNLIQSLTIR